MNFDDFIQALLGGALIGLAGGLLLLMQGRILGVSGIVSQSLREPTQSGWRLFFLLGLLVAPVFFNMIASNQFAVTSTSMSLPASVSLDYWQIVVGALLVGLGTKVGSGCTSGHGICGIGRLSVRSMLATVVFMVTAMVTVFVVRHVML